MTSKKIALKWFSYLLFIGITALAVKGFLDFVFSPSLESGIFGLGKNVVELLGLPETIG